MHAQVLTAFCVLLATAAALNSPQVRTTSAPLPTATVPRGYTYRAATGSFYKYHRTFVPWERANATCAREGAHLVVVNNAEEARLIVDILQDVRGSYFNAWIGLRDNRHGEVSDWRTVFGDPISSVFGEWFGGAPTDDARRACVVLGAYTKQLYAVPCDFSYRFVCELTH